MRRSPAAVGAFAVAIVLGCAGGGFDQRVNVPPLEGYTDALLEASGAPAARGPCGMFGETRAGFCRVTGPGDAVPAFVKGLGLVPGETYRTAADHTCMTLPPFGTPDGEAWQASPGVTVWTPAGTLPPNTDNVVLRRVYVSADGVEACVEYEFPYG
ncbi:MAG: hypothetical protein ACK4YP_09560 [Myxococcota bacterium]